MSRRPPLVIAESAAAYRALVAEITGAGWTLSSAEVTEPADVLDLLVTDAEQAQRAVLAAVEGSGVLVRCRAEQSVVDDLVEDLGRLGRVLVVDDAVALDADTWRLLHALADGETVAVAARGLHMSTRTANRRVTEARTVLAAANRAHLVRTVTGPERIPRARG